jgi:N-acetylglucosamine-6-phosphate deacetylase
MPQTAILAKKIITPGSVIPDGALLVEEGKILDVGTPAQIHFDEAEFQLRGWQVVDCREFTLVPGFIDLHVHGAGGKDFMEGTPEAVEVISKVLASHGTTSYLATTVTASPIATIRAVENLGKYCEKETGGARMLGLHLEGPFINEKKRGVHPPEHIRKPSQRIFDELFNRSGEKVKLVTLAPELEGALELIPHIRAVGAFISMGHSNATLAEALTAIECGILQATHTFNAMREFNHRNTGILGAIFTDSRVWAELIADGIHVDPVAIQVLLRCKGFQKMLLITDSTSATGMPDGPYEVGGVKMQVSSGICRDGNGNLAGSTLTQDRALRNMLEWCPMPLEEAIYMLTRNPAKAIGVEASKGALHPGHDADLTALDDALNVRLTVSAGQIVFQT